MVGSWGWDENKITTSSSHLIPLLKGPGKLLHEGPRQGIEGLGPVEGEEADPVPRAAPLRYDVLPGGGGEGAGGEEARQGGQEEARG